MSAPMSLRLEEQKVEILGHVYPLRCNMAVLERLQNGPGEGEISRLQDLSSYQMVFEIMKAMLDEACEDDPSLPEISMLQLKKLFGPSHLAEMGIFRMFSRAIIPAKPPAAAGTVSGADTGENPGPAPETSGN